MAQEVRIFAWCDNTGEGRAHPENTKIPAEGGPIPVLLPNRQIRLLDLCQQCQDILLTPLHDLAIQEGRREDTGAPSRSSVARPGRRTPEELIARQQAGFSRHGARPKSGERDLPCLLCELDYASDSGLRRHYTVGHGVPKELTPWADFYGDQCPLCGGRYGQLGGHASSAHDGLLSPQVFKVAEDLGDPYGVVAARRKYVLEQIIPGLVEPTGKAPGTKPGAPKTTQAKEERPRKTTAAEHGSSRSSARRPLSANRR